MDGHVLSFTLGWHLTGFGGQNSRVKVNWPLSASFGILNRVKGFDILTTTLGERTALINDKRKRARDAGLAMALGFVVWAWLAGEWILLLPGGVVLVLALTVPVLFAPLAPLWFGLSEAVGAVTSRIVLTLLFWGVLTPIALLRRLCGADPLLLRRWKSDRDSVFISRYRTYSRDDLEKPF